MGIGNHTASAPQNQTLSPASQRRALLICNGQFEHLSFDLPGVAKDAKNLTGLLGDPERSGFDVTCLLDQGLLAVRKGIAEACAASGVSDTLLLYFSGGSGLDPLGSLQMPVADSDPNCLAATCIESDFILSQMRQSKCRRIVLIVDGCHSGAIFHNNRGIPDGMVAITSCSADEVSADTPEGGAFTQSLLRALNSSDADRDHDGGVTVDDVYEFIRKDESFVGSPMTDPRKWNVTHPQKWVWNLPDPIVLVRSMLCVFLSYSTADSDDADAMVAALTKLGISVWRDITGVPGGTRWRDSLVEALGKSQAIVLLMSKKAMDSKWVRRELEFADNKGLPIFPAIVKDFTPPDWFELQFGAIQRQAIDLKDIDTSVTALATAIRRTITQSR